MAAIVAATAIPAAFAAADGAVGLQSREAPSSIVVGFVGGFVSHTDSRQGPVQFAQRLQRDAPKGAYIQVFENRHRKAAYQTLLRLLDRNHDGVLSDDEKSQARIAIVGHSWGASAALLLARELNRDGIPVLLTVQVDSIKKFWRNNNRVPQNVAAAANFYQRHGLLRGASEITATDPARTQILGNYLFDYKKEPVRCEETPAWYDRFLTPGHAQAACDPHLWSQVESLVLQHMASSPNTVANR